MSIGMYLNFVLALLFVIGLIGLAAWTYRRFAMGRGTPLRLGAKSARLDVVEVRAIDARRRLVLVRRDTVEHLLLLGPTTETVVEAGIARTVTPGMGAGR